MTTKSLLTGLATALFLIGWSGGVQACQYCRMAATDPEAARMAAQMHSGGFPLDATINQFQGIARAATLTVPPTPDSVVTSAADLPVPLARSQSTPKLAVPARPQLSKVVPAARAASKPVSWANAGLMGLAAMGGLFCWRTRRVSAPVV